MTKTWIPTENNHWAFHLPAGKAGLIYKNNK